MAFGFVDGDFLYGPYKTVDQTKKKFLEHCDDCGFPDADVYVTVNYKDLKAREYKSMGYSFKFDFRYGFADFYGGYRSLKSMMKDATEFGERLQDLQLWVKIGKIAEKRTAEISLGVYDY